MGYILIVDDEPEIVELIKIQFENLGHRIMTASDGADAYRKARNQKFELICTDFNMPKVTGGDLISALRENPYNSTTPIIVYTGYLEPAMEFCKPYSNIEYVNKPSLNDELEKKAQELLESGGNQKDPNKDFVNAFMDATIKTMEIMANAKKISPLKGKQPLDDIEITSYLEVSSPKFQGILNISFPKETYLNTISSFLDEEHKEITKENQEVAIELIKIIFGQMKPILNIKGYQLDKSFASFSRGPFIQLSKTDDMVIMPFTSSLGQFYLSVKATV
jgi:CheY-like chemotaxis protein